LGVIVDDGKIIALGVRLKSWAVNEIDGRNMIAIALLQIGRHAMPSARDKCLSGAIL
jgi:hypothetical protein